MKSDKAVVIKNKPVIKLIEVQGDFKVCLKWSRAEGADGYVVSRSTSTDGPYTKIAKLPYDKFSFTDETIDSEGQYWYKVIAKRSAFGEEKASKKASVPVCVNIATMNPPEMESISSPDNKCITFKWNNTGSEAPSFYNIYKRYSFMKQAYIADSTDGDKNEYTDKSVVKGSLIYYSVQAVIKEENDIRYSSVSSELCSICLDKVKIMDIKRKIGKKVLFSLRLSAGADGYVLFKSDSENGEYTEVSRTNSISSLTCYDKGGKGEKGAFYAAACVKKLGEAEIIGPKSDAVYVKYK